ncbi:MAG TPA: hypothetical protein VFS00_09115, partial [Polyangiaceae bacterium]|nr:hypothetical protein [Polyangiaceae bacterium]
MTLPPVSRSPSSLATLPPVSRSPSSLVTPPVGSSRLRPSRPLGPALRAAADSLLAALALVVAEAFAVSVLFGRELAGGWQVRSAFAQLVPLAWAVAAPIALAGALIAGGLRRAERGRRARAALAALGASFAGLVAFGVTSG